MKNFNIIYFEQADNFSKTMVWTLNISVSSRVSPRGDSLFGAGPPKLARVHQNVGGSD